MNRGEIGLGVIGCGAFGLYALQHFTQVPGIRLVAMAGTHREAAYAAAKRFGIPEPVEVSEMVALPEVDMVYIATPPFLHYEQAMKALRAGKHVLCEKPLAMDLGQADQMIAEAHGRGLLLVANLMQRYNPLFDQMRLLIERKLLGDLLYCSFENLAADESLDPRHWFWKRDLSGGIFIEHGVHFFDLFHGWLGSGKVEAAQITERPGTPFEDQGLCTVRYGETVLVHFFHSFTQVGRMDRQQMRFIFERGDVTLHHWVPTLARMHAVADEEHTRLLMELFPGARLDITENYAPRDRVCSGRHRQLDIYQKLELTYGEGHNKMHRYGELLRAFAADQTAWIRDRSHERCITEENGRQSLAMAVDADCLAHGGR